MSKKRGSILHQVGIMSIGSKPSIWLAFYADHFSTVEINSSFYHLPTSKTIHTWAAETPKDFIFSVKASRYITHIKRLKDSKASVKTFLKSITPLHGKLVPILFQVPPNFERLKICIEQLPPKQRYTFEFRHDSWFVQEVFDLLNKHHSALCINLNFGLSSSDSEEFKRRSWDFLAEANGQGPFARTKSTRDAGKFPEDEEVKPEVQVTMAQI